MVSLKQSHPVDTDTEGTIVSVRINRFEFKELWDKASKSVRELSVRIIKGVPVSGVYPMDSIIFQENESIFSVSSRNAPA